MNELHNTRQSLSHLQGVAAATQDEMSLVDGGGSLLDQIIQVIKAGSEIIKNIGPVIT